MRYLVGRDVLQTIPVAKVKHWDKTIPLFTKGEYPDGRKASRQGTTPWTVLYATDAGRRKGFTDGTHRMADRHADDHQCRYAWHPARPDRPPGHQLGRSAAARISRARPRCRTQPTVGVIDVALALEARGEIKYGDKGNMTKDGDRQDHQPMHDRSEKATASSARSGRLFDQSVNLMASGEVVIQSMWSPGSHRGAVARHSLHFSR